MTAGLPDAQAARRALACLDLTDLAPAAGPGDALALCGRAVTPHGPVAAVCLWPRFVPLAREALAGTPVRVATVAGFPEGRTVIDETAAACAEAAAHGADEVDLVFPYRAWLRGERDRARDHVRICRAALGRGRTLKVILETAVFEAADRREALAEAAAAVLEAGADFLKTSTGRLGGATPEAARTLLGVVRAGAGDGTPLAGVKVSGAVRTPEAAAGFLALADEALGAANVDRGTFRIGASGLLDGLLSRLDRARG